MPNASHDSERIEFSLDNRQVLFLLFGLLVISAMVFVMGFLVGVRSNGLAGNQGWASQDVMAANIRGDGDEAGFEGADEESFAFEKGVQHDAAKALPPTREAGLAPRDEKAVRAERFRADRAQIEATQADPGTEAPFTLQIKRFKDKEAANVLRARILRHGFTARIGESTRGDFVVTVGDFHSWKDALEAKNAFESKVGVVAYAARQ